MPWIAYATKNCWLVSELSTPDLVLCFSYPVNHRHAYLLNIVKA